MSLRVHSAKVKPDPENPVCLITGDGRSSPDDIKEFLSWEVPHDVMSIGRSINLYPGRVLHWANVDSSEGVWWAEHLPLKNDGKMPVRHTLGDVRGYDVDWDIVDEVQWNVDEILWHGSTALFSVYACLALGYEKIVLAGCPMDSKGHWYFDEKVTGPTWTGASFQAWLEFAKDPKSSKVRSLSGYTAQIIGVATKEWLNGSDGRQM